VPLEPLIVYNSADYFSTLCSLVAQTTRGSRIALMAMSYDPTQPHIAELMNELTNAAARGVYVYLLVDAFSFTMDRRHLPTGPAITQRPIHTSQRPHFRERYLPLENLERHGGHYAVINNPKKTLTNPFGGRSHIKIAVVDDTAFLGGCNLEDQQIDYMVRFNHKTTVDWLYEFAVQTAEQKSVRQVLHDTDQKLSIDDKTTVFVDSGKPKQSIIYKTALDFIDSAQEWLVMTCQYFPNTVTADHLEAAVRRGVHVVLYYNHPRHHAPHTQPIHHAVIMGEKLRHSDVLFAHQLPKNLQRLHAKLIVNEHGAMIGSHNYVTHGVNFGTAEIAIQRYDSSFAQEALQILKQQLPESHTKALLQIL
jgi:phosphatidylserine/phosphatidylglycerophosphate/cardiolipin synthase-like enzyme